MKGRERRRFVRVWEGWVEEGKWEKGGRGEAGGGGGGGGGVKR